MFYWLNTWKNARCRCVILCIYYCSFASVFKYRQLLWCLQDLKWWNIVKDLRLLCHLCLLLDFRHLYQDYLKLCIWKSCDCMQCFIPSAKLQLKSNLSQHGWSYKISPHLQSSIKILFRVNKLPKTFINICFYIDFFR